MARGVTGRPEPMQSVERAITVLEYLAAGGQPSGPSEISRALELSKPAVIRILQTWLALGYVEHVGRQYELGWKILTLANARSEAHELHTAARSLMAWLNAESGETIHLAVRRDAEVVYIDKIDGSRRIRVTGDVGRSAPLYATASGKAILANLPAEIAEELITRPVEALTEFTITDIDQLRKDLARTRVRQYSVNHGEWHEQVGGVGAAIFGRDGNVEAALSILYPMAETTPARVALLGELVRSAAERVSRQRGWGGSLGLAPMSGPDGTPVPVPGAGRGTPARESGPADPVTKSRQGGPAGGKVQLAD